MSEFSLRDAEFANGRPTSINFSGPRAAVLQLAERVPQGLPRFLVAGGAASLVNWLVRFPISGVLPFWLAVAAAYGIGMVIGFGLYRAWVFPGSEVPLGQQILRFMLVNAAGMATVIFGAAGLVLVFGATKLLSPAHAEALAHGLAIVCGATVNFLGHRAVTFARQALGR